MPDQPRIDAYDQAVMRRMGAPFGMRRTASADNPEVAEMRRNRAVSRKQAAAGGGSAGGGNGSMQFATGRPRDPLFYWKQNNLPYDVGEHAELTRVRAYCNTPEAPVWMGDYSFKPIGEIVPGEEVIGWTYKTGGLGQQRKVLTRTKVLATKRRMAPEVVKITFESGRTIRCTPDHLWANPHYSPGQVTDQRSWRQPEFRRAKVGQHLIRVVTPTEPLTDQKQQRAADWLAGIYDGEGTAERLAQDEAYNPAVRQRIKESLDLLGIPWTEDARAIYIRRAGKRTRLDGARQDFIDFLNWGDPVRRVTNAVDKKLLTQPTAGREKIVSIESEGPGEVVSMQTETGNYTAWGLASKNCRLLYMSHPLIASCIDIYSKYPLLGMELECKDSQLTDFYSDLFFSEDGLNYDEFLLDVGREYWTVGEAWPFGSFNESLGVWEDEELLNPDDVEVERSPFLKEPRFLIRLPETLRRVITSRSPAWEYTKLLQAYPELVRYASEDDRMPVSNILLRQMRFKADTFNKRGIPILMRAMRSVMQEEMLNAAMDAIADRLYTPLILVRLGASATDLGTTQPWIPTPDDLEDFNESLDMAMAGDFRVLTHHFATQMESVFGREQMPDLNPDFERLEDRILQTFGLSRTMLSGASSGQTYAADALNRDLISQLLTTFQDLIKRHYRQRALVVAEAQEHYDYDVRGGKRYVKMEEILEVDEESGAERIVEQPKLLVPDLHMKTMNLSDEESAREFLESLRGAGVPISIKTRLVNVPIDFDEEVERTRDEQVALAVAEQQTRKEQYLALRAEGLPIPQALRDDFEPKAEQGQTDAVEGERSPTLGVDPTTMTPNLAPTGEDLGADQTEGVASPGMAVVPVQADPDQGGVDPDAQVPPESNEQRGSMPKPAALLRQASRMREVTAAHYRPPEHLVQVQHGEDLVEVTADWEPPAGFDAPKHVGMRRHAEHVRRQQDTPMEEWR